MDRYEIRALATEHFLNEWRADGWEVDHARGEICVGDSWFPVEALPRILSNHMASVHSAEKEAKRAAMLAEHFGHRAVRPDTEEHHHDQ